MSSSSKILPCPVELTDELRAADAARRASLECDLRRAGVDGATLIDRSESVGLDEPRCQADGDARPSSSMTDQEKVMVGLQGLVECGLARWSLSASRVRTLVLVSGEQFVVTEAGISRRDERAAR